MTNLLWILRAALPLAALLLCTPARAQTTLEASAGVSNLDQGASVNGSWQASAATRWQLELDLNDVRTGFIDGFAVDSGSEARLAAGAEHRLDVRGPVAMMVRWRAGVGRISTDEMLVDDAATLALAELGLFAEIAATRRLTVRIGTNVPLDLAVSPTVDLALTGNTLTSEAYYRLTGALDVFARSEVGGVFGYGGDGAKWRALGFGGVRWNLTRDAAPGSIADSATETAQANDDRTIAPFVGLAWRALRVGGHTSHGPAFEAGVRWRGVKLGLAGFSRPGPINPRTFTVEAADGMTYRGSSTLDLRSDGSFLGVLVAPVFAINDRLALEVPITVGQAAFGFYLTGDDRDTPDGRRVSDWENELLDGRDAAIALAAEGGLRATYDLTGTDWLRATAAVHYLQTFGYDAFVRDDYSGLSTSLGLQVSTF